MLGWLNGERTTRQHPAADILPSVACYIASHTWHHLFRQPQHGFRLAVAMTSYCSQISLMFLPEIRDPNRGGQLRLDYVFENLEGVRCQLHPGNKGKDATPIFIQL